MVDIKKDLTDGLEVGLAPIMNHSASVWPLHVLGGFLLVIVFHPASATHLTFRDQQKTIRGSSRVVANLSTGSIKRAREGHHVRQRWMTRKGVKSSGQSAYLVYAWLHRV